MMYKNILANIKNYRNICMFLVLVFGILVRLYGIDSPVADWHSFRQVDTLSVSKMYLKNGINFLVPRYHDISTIQSGLFNPEGYRFVEFPLYNALITQFYRLFPSVELTVWGRFISIFLTILSAFLLYILGNRFIGFWGGVGSAFIFLFIPFNIFFSRVILPEPIATTTGLLGLTLFVYWLDRKRKTYLFFSALFYSLALLVKPFTVFYLTPVVFLALREYSPLDLAKVKLLIKKYFLFSVFVVIPFLLWRYWESFYPEGIPFLKWIFNGDNIRFKPSFWRWIFGERLGYLILGTWGLIPFAFGLVTKSKHNFVNHFILGMFLYVCVVATANVRHDYYQTLTIPAISMVVAVGANYLMKKDINSKLILIFSLFIMMMVGLTRVREYYKIDHPEIIEAGVVVEKLTAPDSLIIAPYNGDTAFLYQTGRMGWPYVDRPIDEMIDKGADYYVSVNFDTQTNEFMEMFPIVKKTDEYVILKLN